MYSGDRRHPVNNLLILVGRRSEVLLDPLPPSTLNIPTIKQVKEKEEGDPANNIE
jgi:hypothetical protein